jgi:hypothetical protein
LLPEGRGEKYSHLLQKTSCLIRKSRISLLPSIIYIPLKNTKFLPLVALLMSATFVSASHLEAANSPVSTPTLGRVTAAIAVTGGVSTKLSPNTEGIFPRVIVPASGTVAITLTYSGGAVGDRVVFVAEDGGSINGKVVGTGSLDATHSVSFTFKTTSNEGIFRVQVRKGADQNVLQFWVGAEPALK